MSKLVKVVVIGAVLAAPLVYILELNSTGAIALLILLVVAVVSLVMAIAQSIAKRKRGSDDAQPREG